MAYLPSLKQLEYLLTLAEHNSFSKAADLCHVTQSTMSASIADLEGRLGLHLIERGKRFQVLTQEGEAIASRAREIMALSKDMLDFAESRKKPLTGRIRVGAIPTIGPFIFPKFAHQIHAQYPLLNLSLHEGQTETLLSYLSEGNIDAAIMAFPYDTSNLKVEIIAEDPLLLLVPEKDPITAQSSIDPNQLAADSLMLLEDGHCLRDHALNACNLQGVKQPDGFAGTSLLTLSLMVELEQGYTLIPKLALQSGLLDGIAVKSIPLSTPHASRSIGLAWRQSSPRKEEFKLLAETLRLIANAS